MGLKDFGKQSIGRTKLRANPGKRKTMSNCRMKQEEAWLSSEIQALLARAVDAEEHARLGEAVRGDELPEVLKAARGVAGGNPGGEDAGGCGATATET